MHVVSGRLKQTQLHIKLPCSGGTDWRMAIRLTISVEGALQAGTGGKGVTAHYSGPPDTPGTPPQHSWEPLLDVLVVPLLHRVQQIPGHIRSHKRQCDCSGMVEYSSLLGCCNWSNVQFARWKLNSKAA